MRSDLQQHPKLPPCAPHGPEVIGVFVGTGVTMVPLASATRNDSTRSL